MKIFLEQFAAALALHHFPPQRVLWLALSGAAFAVGILLITAADVGLALVIKDVVPLNVYFSGRREQRT